MIGALRGVPVAWRPPVLLLDVNGVGYELHAPSSLHFTPDRAVRLFTHLIIRDDQMQLYGFESERQRDLFRSLLKISGVGARMGLAILSTWTMDELVRIVGQDDVKALTRVPGIGRKTAERLLVALRHRLEADGLMTASPEATAPVIEAGAQGQGYRLARQALEQLGYRAAEAERLLAAVEGAETLSVGELVKRALKQAHRG